MCSVSLDGHGRTSNRVCVYDTTTRYTSAVVINTDGSGGDELCLLYSYLSRCWHVAGATAALEAEPCVPVGGVLAIADAMRGSASVSEHMMRELLSGARRGFAHSSSSARFSFGLRVAASRPYRPNDRPR